jgi:MFS family permease
MKVRRPPSPTRWFWAMIPYNASAAAVSPLNALFVTEVLGGDVTAVGTLAAVTALASVPAAGLWGALIDRFGRRGPFIVLGLLGFGLPVVLIGLSQSLVAAYALSFAMGFVSLAINPASTALVTAGTPRSRWAEAFGSYNWLAGLGAITGLLVGTAWMDGLPQVLGNVTAMRGLMVGAGLAGIASALLAWRWLPPEPARPPKADAPAGESSPSGWRPFGAWRQDPWLRYILAYFLGRLSTNLALTPFAIFLTDDLHASASVVFAAYVLNQAVPTFAYRPMSRWLRGGSAVQLMLLSSLGRAAGLLLGTFAALAGAGWWGLVLAMLLYGPVIGLSWAGMAVAGPIVVMELVPPERAGRGMGLYNAVANLAAIVGAYLSGVSVLALGYGGLFTASAVIGIVGAAAFLLVRSPALTVATVES